MFDLRTARYFVAVAEELHFGNAAARLQMSQPPLSQAIRQLERDVGVALFERTNRRVALTVAGEAFLPECRDLLRRADAAAETPRLAARGIRTVLTIGTVASALTWPLADVLQKLRPRAPHIAIHLRELDTHEVSDKLRDGQIDIALARVASQRPGITTTTLVRDQFVALLPADHPRASEAGRLDLALLAEEPWVWLDRSVSPDYHDDMTAACRRSGFSPQASHWARSIASQLAMVNCGVGVTIIPATMSANPPSGVIARSLHGTPPAVTLTVSTRSHPEPAVRLLRDLIIETAAR